MKTAYKVFRERNGELYSAVYHSGSWDLHYPKGKATYGLNNTNVFVFLDMRSVNNFVAMVRGDTFIHTLWEVEYGDPLLRVQTVCFYEKDYQLFWSDLNKFNSYLDHIEAIYVPNKGNVYFGPSPGETYACKWVRPVKCLERWHGR